MGAVSNSQAVRGLGEPIRQAREPEPLIFLVLSPQRGVLTTSCTQGPLCPLLLLTEVNQAAAVIAVLGLALMALGCLCIIMVLSKGAEFLLRVGAVCFGLSGEG